MVISGTRMNLNSMNIKYCGDNENDDGHRGGNVNDDEEGDAIFKEDLIEAG